MLLCSMNINMLNNNVNMRGYYVDMRISHITCQHKYMLHVEINYVYYRRLRYTTIAYRCFWFSIIRPGGNMVCCDGEVWNISLQTCQRKWTLNCIIPDVSVLSQREPVLFYVHLNRQIIFCSLIFLMFFVVFFSLLHKFNAF